MISFSGLDGAGKSTLIASLINALHIKGKKTVIRTMYDNLSFYAQVRIMRDALLGRPTKPTNEEEHTYNLIPNKKKPDVSDKQSLKSKLLYGFVRSRTIRRLSILADMMVILFFRFWDEILHGRILITDRYIYDSLVDTLKADLGQPDVPSWIIPLSPSPNLAVFVDVPPAVAYERKKEYPLDYLEWRRNAYLAVFKLEKTTLVLDNTRPLDVNVTQLMDKLPT